MEDENFKVTDITLERQRIAEDVVTDILKGKFPNIIKLTSLCDSNKVWALSSLMENFIESNIQRYIKEGNSVRNLSDIRNSEIYIKHHEAQSLGFFIHSDDKITEWGLPEAEEMNDFFGDYAPYVTKTFSTFHKLREDRNCGLPSAIHLLRASAMAYALGFDNNSGKPDKYYAALWALHDTVEDLLSKIRKDNGRKMYGLEKITEFLDEFIPEDMQEDIMMVTNKSDLILNHLNSNKKRFGVETKTEMIYGLDSLLKGGRYGFLHEDIYKMKKILEKLHLKSGRASFYNDVKWEFYKRIFINDLAEQAYEKNHFALFEGKGTVDLLDNCISILAEDITRSRRAMLKVRLWADKADEILVRAKSQNSDYPSHFERNLWETMNYANFKAREFLINYFAESMSHSGHLKIGLKSIDILKPVLYTREYKSVKVSGSH